MSKFDINKYFSNVFLFENLTNKERQKLASQCSLKRVPKNTVIFEQKDEANAFYIVVYGKVSVFRLNSEGVEQIIHIQMDGEIIAEAALFDSVQYPASSKTLSDSLLIKIPKKAFIDLIIENPQTALKMMAAYSKRLREFVQKVEYLSTDDIKNRLLKFLNKNKSKNNEGEITVKLNITKKELAHLLGTIPETLSRNIRQLKNNGIIEEAHGLFIIKRSL